MVMTCQIAKLKCRDPKCEIIWGLEIIFSWRRHNSPCVIHICSISNFVEEILGITRVKLCSLHASQVVVNLYYISSYSSQTIIRMALAWVISTSLTHYFIMYTAGIFLNSHHLHLKHHHHRHHHRHPHLHNNLKLQSHNMSLGKMADSTTYISATRWISPFKS